MSDSNTSKNVRGGVFPDEETFQRIYGGCLENQPQASEKIKDSHKEMRHWFGEYLAACDEHMFRYAYQCGYEAAKKEYQGHAVPIYSMKGGAAV